MFQWINPRGPNNIAPDAIAPDAMATNAMAPNDMTPNDIDIVYYILSGKIIEIRVEENCNYVYNVYQVKITNNKKSEDTDFFDYELMTEEEYKNNFVNKKIPQTTENYCDQLSINDTVYFAVPGQVLRRIDSKSYSVKPLEPIIAFLYGSSPIEMNVNNLMTEKQRDMFFKRKIGMPAIRGGGSRRRRRNKKSTRRRRRRRH